MARECRRTVTGHPPQEKSTVLPDPPVHGVGRHLDDVGPGQQ